MGFATPTPYLDRYNNPSTVTSPTWYRELFNVGVDVQSAELNEIQSMIDQKIAYLGDAIFSPGTFTSGGQVTVNLIDSALTVTIQPGQLWAEATHNVPGGSVVITGSGTEIISLIIGEVVTTSQQDPTLNDPAIGAENFGYPGADRLSFSYTYALNSSQGIPVVTLINGQISQTQPTNGFLEQLYAILAQRTSEQSGQFIAVQPSLTPQDVSALSDNPLQFTLLVDGGVFYNQGYRLTNTTKLSLAVQRPLTGQPVIDEPVTPLSGVLVYQLANEPVLSIQSINATVQSPNIPMVRGLTVNGSDSIPSEWQPISSIVSITQVGNEHSPFIQGTDFNRSGNLINWLETGNQPATGSSYVLVDNYTVDLVKAIRTYGTVANEAHTVASSGVTNLTNTYISEYDFVLIDATTSTTLVMGTDYTLNLSTGAITWINRPTGHTIHASYGYWTHTIEGDFVSRDSWIYSGGVNAYSLTPTHTVSGIATDYETNIDFDVTNGKAPVVGIDIQVSYNFTLGRIDVVACDSNGIIEVIQGNPGISPAAVTLSNEYVPITKLILPPEATAEDVVKEWYNNVTLYVTDLQAMNQQIQNLQYNVGVFQLQQSAANMTTATDKLGVFADDFSTPGYVDIGSSYFAGTFDYLARTYGLPRTTGIASPNVSTATGASLKEDIWLLNYTEQVGLTQPYRSISQVINEFGAVNQRAVVSCNPTLAVGATEDVTVQAVGHNGLYTVGTSDSMILTEISGSSAAATSLGTTAGALAAQILNQVEVNPDWVQSSTTTSSSSSISDSWATVTSSLQVVTGTPLPSQLTITVTGKNFLPNDRAIQCMFDGVPVPLTPAGSTVAETDPAFPNTVVADNFGNWNATFPTPPTCPVGLHTLNFCAHLTSDVNQITSLASCTFRTGGVATYIDEYVSLAALPTGYPCDWVPATYLCAILGFNPTQSILNSSSGPMAYTFAYAVAQAVQNGVTLTTELVQAAIAIALGSTTFETDGSSGLANALALSIADLLTSTNVSALASAFYGVSGIVGNSLGGNSLCFLDPLAQTFTMTNDCFITSIDIFFSTTPVDQVAVALATTEVGIPTTNYLAVKYLSPSQINTTSKTNFAFDKPIFVNGNTEYAFVVLTSDTVVALWSAVLGQKDVNTNQLIISNPASGTLLQSTNAQSWTPLSGHDLQFNINTAQFSETTGTLNFGQIAFNQASSIIAFWMPFSEPSEDTSVIYQYSLDNQTWQDFDPLVEKDLGNSEANVYLRVVLNGTATLSPTVFNYTSLMYFIYLLSGGYAHRYFDLPVANGRYIDVYCNVDAPGNTSVAFWASTDEGVTWHAMSEDTGSTYPLNIDGTYFQRHFVYDGGEGATIQHITTRCALATTVDYVSPKLMKYIAMARST